MRYIATWMIQTTILDRISGEEKTTEDYYVLSDKINAVDPSNELQIFSTFKGASMNYTESTYFPHNSSCGLPLWLDFYYLLFQSSINIYRLQHANNNYFTSEEPETLHGQFYRCAIVYLPMTL
jgi:hypothetical protein